VADLRKLTKGRMIEQTERAYILGVTRAALKAYWPMHLLCELSRAIHRGPSRYLLPDGTVSTGMSEEDAMHEWIFALPQHHLQTP